MTHELLLTYLCYNPETGIFTWKIRASNNVFSNQEAGNISSQGYIIITINKINYRAHRLAWFYINKEWPKGILDHIDRNKQNNAITNLRLATHSVNRLNSKINSNNTSTISGVHYDQRNQLWIAKITIRKKMYYLGSFNIKEDAITARKNAEKDFLVKLS